MKYFLRTVNLDEISKAFEQYKISGVFMTTKSLNEIENDLATVAIKIADWIKENNLEGVEKFPVLVEVYPFLKTYEDIINEATKLFALSENFIVNIPANKEGMKASKVLEENGFKTNIINVFSISQAIQAGRINSHYASISLGPRGMGGNEAITLIENVMGNYKIQGYGTKIIISDINNVHELNEVEKLGVKIIALDNQILEESFEHPYSQIVLKESQEATLRYKKPF